MYSVGIYSRVRRACFEANVSTKLRKILPFFFLRIWALNPDLPLALTRSAIVPMGVPFSHGFSIAETSEHSFFRKRV